MEMIINIVRMVDHDQVKEFSFGDDNSLMENLAIGLINPEDFKKLNLTGKSNVKLSNDSGMVIIKPEQEENVPVGTLVMPVSIWANQITKIENNELIYKNIKALVEETTDSVKTLKALLTSIENE